MTSYLPAHRLTVFAPRSIDPTEVTPFRIAGNLIENDNWEIDATGSLGVVGGAATKSSTWAISGASSLKIDVANSNFSGALLRKRDASRFPGTAGLQYIFEYWMFATGSAIGKSMYAYINWYNSGGGIISASSAATTLVAGWNKLSVTATAPALTATIDPEVICNGAQGTFTVWCDLPWLGVTGATPHRDALQITTLPNVSAWPGHLYSLPIGRTGRVDVLSKKTDIGQQTFTVLDHILTSQSARWFTSFLGDAKGRGQLMGLKVFVEQSLDGGATWAPYWTGRLQTIDSDGKLKFSLSVSDLNEDLKMKSFVSGTLHANVQSYAGPLSLLPLGVTVPYGPLQPPAPLPASVHTSITIANGAYVTLSDGGARAENRVTKELLKASLPPIQDSNTFFGPGVPFGEIPKYGGPLRTKIKHLSGANSGSTGVYKIGYLWTSSFARQETRSSFVLALAINALDDTSEPGYLALPAAGVTLSIIATWIESPAEIQPIVIGDVHPAQFEKDLAAGYFGYLYKPGEIKPSNKNFGDAKRSVPVATSVFTTLITDLTFPTFRGIITASEEVGAFIEKNINPSYSLGFFLDALGTFTPIDLRLPTSAPGITISDADVEPSNSGWEQSRTQAVQRVDTQYYYDYLPPPPSTDNSDVPSIIDIVVKSIANPLEVLDIGTSDIGDVVASFDAPGYRYMAGETINNVSRQNYMVNQLSKFARELTRPFGSGAMTCMLNLRRSVTVPKPGDLRIISVSWLPDPNTNVRGGSRVMRCTELTENGLLLSARFLDYGTSGTAGVPSLGTPTKAPAPFDKNAINEVVTLNAAGDPVELNVAVTPTSVGSAPAVDSPLWYWPWPMYPGLLTFSLTVLIPVLPGGQRIWVRGRSRPGGYSIFQQPSAWVVTASVDLTTLTAPSGLSITNVGSTKLTVNYTPAAGMKTQLLLSQPNGQPYTLYATLPPGTTSCDVIGLDPSTTVGIKLRSTDGVGGYSAEITTTQAMSAPGSDAALGIVLAFRLTNYS